MGAQRQAARASNGWRSQQRQHAASALLPPHATRRPGAREKRESARVSSPNPSGACSSGRAESEWKKKYQQGDAEEAIAMGLEDIRDGREKPGPVVARIMQKAKQFFERLGNWLRGNGFQSAEDVFARVASGEIGRRPPRSSSQRNGLFTHPGVAVTRVEDTPFTAKAARAWALQHLRRTYSNTDTGWEIIVSRSGIEKATSESAHTGEAHLKAIRELPTLIERSVLAESYPNRRPDPNIVAFHRFYAPVRIGATLYRAKLTVQEDRQGRRFYTKPDRT